MPPSTRIHTPSTSDAPENQTTFKRKAISTIDGLVDAELIRPDEVDLLNNVAENFSLRITPHAQHQIRESNVSDPIYLQYIPSKSELIQQGDERSDPIGDEAHNKLKGITHRYPDRLLLTPTHTCEVYCRFCFRREKVGQADEALNQEELQNALIYIKQNKEVWEVILSGGDPMILSTRRIRQILGEIEKIDHVGVVRFHTRMPVVNPAKVTQTLADAMKIKPSVYVVIHINHPAELTDEVKTALSLFVDNGIPLLSQTVLLKGVNDSAETLSQLMRGLVENRVKPYYLHHLDKAQGVGHFRCSIEEGQEIVRELRGRLSGMCQPTYVLDIPGGHGKVPIGPTYIQRAGNSNYLVEDYMSVPHRYEDIQ